jgi:hypothetical protein
MMHIFYPGGIGYRLSKYERKEEKTVRNYYAPLF